MKVVTLNTLKYVISKLTKNNALNAYPIGSVYMSLSNVNPSDLFGGYGNL